MSKNKSISVTATIGVMLVLIAIDSYYLRFPLFIIMIGVFVVLGLAAASFALYKWLGQPSKVDAEPDAETDELDEDRPYDVNAIIGEVETDEKKENTKEFVVPRPAARV